MRPGHEDCGHDVETVEAYSGLASRVIHLRTFITCYHDHAEPVQADDGLGSGPIVADYCHCCDNFIWKDVYQ